MAFCILNYRMGIAQLGFLFNPSATVSGKLLFTHCITEKTFENRDNLEGKKKTIIHLRFLNN